MPRPSHPDRANADGTYIGRMNYIGRAANGNHDSVVTINLPLLRSGSQKRATGSYRRLGEDIRLTLIKQIRVVMHAASLRIARRYK